MTVMRSLRKGDGQKKGRLEPTRMQVRAKDGSLIPVTISAALVYEKASGRSRASGVMSDLRHQLRIEERLVEAQEKLIVSERQAGSSPSLAGTAAHEPPQPAAHVGDGAIQELLKKRMWSRSDPHYRADQTRSCARPSAWPEIVRKNRSHQCEVRDQGVRRRDPDHRPREVERPWVTRAAYRSARASVRRRCARRAAMR